MDTTVGETLARREYEPQLARAQAPEDDRTRASLPAWAYTRLANYISPDPANGETLRGSQHITQQVPMKAWNVPRLPASARRWMDLDIARHPAVPSAPAA